jgi:hypothetical protein
VCATSASHTRDVPCATSNASGGRHGDRAREQLLRGDGAYSREQLLRGGGAYSREQLLWPPRRLLEASQDRP